MGKGTKKRSCPAVGKIISSAECGGGRHRRFACPRGCPYDPFSPENYDQALEIETRVDQCSMVRLTHIGGDPVGILEDCEAFGDAPDATLRTHVRFVEELFLKPQCGGLSLYQNWAEEDFPELKRNDERVLAAHKASLTATVLEVRQVLDDRSILAADLFASPDAPLIELVDRSLASRAVRFQALVGMLHPLPHYWRLVGSCLTLPELATWEPLKVARTLFAHLGAPDDLVELRRWLLENFVFVSEAINAIGASERNRLFSNLKMVRIVTDYTVRGSLEACLAELESIEEVEWEQLEEEDRADGWTHARVWLDPESPRPARAQSTPVSGRVLAGPAGFRLEVNPGGTRIRERFEAVLGPRVRFVREESEDLAADLKARLEPFDEARVPPAFITENSEIAIFSGRFDREAIEDTPGDDPDAFAARETVRWFLDSPLPSLDGKRPGEAAADPALRPRLIPLVKSQIRGHDRRNLEKGRHDDINWMVRELGLEEFDLPAPPLRAALQNAPRSEELPSRRSAPPLARHPLTEKTVERILRENRRKLPSMDDVEAELEASDAPLFDLIDELSGDNFSDFENEVLDDLAVEAWFALVPVGCRAPELPQEAITEDLQRMMEVVAENFKDPTPKDLFDSLSSEPFLLKALFAQASEALSGAEDFEPEPKQRARVLTFFTLILAALINAIVRARQRR